MANRTHRGDVLGLLAIATLAVALIGYSYSSQFQGIVAGDEQKHLDAAARDMTDNLLMIIEQEGTFEDSDPAVLAHAEAESTTSTE